MKSKQSAFSFIFLLFLMVGVVPVYAQHDAADEKLLNDFIASMGYDHPIVFDTSNIKQFWIDKTIAAKDNKIMIALHEQTQGKWESNMLPIQLANVDVTLDCRIDVITENPSIVFSVLNQDNKVLSSSNPKDDFLNYHIVSTSFHLCETSEFMLRLKFFSESENIISAKKIILSFSEDSQSFSISPGVLKIGFNEIATRLAKKEPTNDEYSFVISGKNSQVLAQKKIIVTDNTLNNKVTVKNIGKKPTRVYLGYAPYTKDGYNIDNRSIPYHDFNKILKVVSRKGSNGLIVDSYPEKWEKGCFLALDAKEDLSDFPNCVFAGRIKEITKLDNNQAEILFEEPISKVIKIGTPVRIQRSYGAAFAYTNIQIVQPGEEITLTSSIKKDDAFFDHSGKAFCRGTYYVMPILLSLSYENSEENTIQVSDFTVNY